jgi:hypothetical protein
MSLQITLDDDDLSVQKKRRKSLEELLPNYELIGFRTVYMTDKLWFVIVLYKDKKERKIGLFRFYRKESRWIKIQGLSFSIKILEYVKNALDDYTYYVDRSEW